MASAKAFIDAREASFRMEILSAADAVADAIAVSAGASRPVVIADTQDNPGGGGHGDTTGLLAELIRQDAQGAVLCLINDDEAATACHAAGGRPQRNARLGFAATAFDLRPAVRCKPNLKRWRGLVLRICIGPFRFGC